MEKETEEIALALARIIEDGRGEDVRVLDVSHIAGWTDCFVIATVTSGTQMEFLVKSIKDYMKSATGETRGGFQKGPQGDDWRVLDLGRVVVHLMSRAARDFYALEELWHEAPALK